ncbi:hypothetical protein [Hominifimenecus microfluidus]|nr:hypothetical protein [Hominifimenecus microfluidus]
MRETTESVFMEARKNSNPPVEEPALWLQGAGLLPEVFSLS